MKRYPNTVGGLDPLHGFRRPAAICVALWLTACGDPQPRIDAPGLRVGDVLGSGDTGAGFARAEVPREFVFPIDHGPHPEFRSEWWYLTLALEDARAREFGVQFTIFRQASFPGAPADDPWRNGQSYLGHFAVTDVRAGKHREAERLSRGHPALAGAWSGEKSDAIATGSIAADLFSGHSFAVMRHSGGSPAKTPEGGEGGFVVWLEGWQLAATGDRWRLEAAADGFAASIDMMPGKPVVPQGDRGLSAKGPGQASHYYSVPRLRASGRLRIDGVAHRVRGNGWLDREWSTSVLGPQQIGWDWFALMLENGEDIMAFRLRREDGARDPYDHGVLVAADGRARRLGVHDFSLQPLDHWRDERGTEWPIRWALTVDRRRWEIAAPVVNQRMDTLLTYWEGLVHVRDRRGERVGRGYMELTGYR